MKSERVHLYKILTILNPNATSFFRSVGLRYRHNIIVLYGLHVINHILLFSVSYFTSFINMVNVKINDFLLSLTVKKQMLILLRASQMCTPKDFKQKHNPSWISIK